MRWDSPSGVQTQATNTRGRASFGNDLVKVDWGTARLTSTITPWLVNEVRVQYARDFELQVSQTPLPGEPRTAINGSAPDVNLQGGLNFGKPNFLERSSYPNEKRTQFTDNVTATLGGNTLKFGGDINYVRDVLNNLFTESGSFLYNNVNEFIIDYSNSLKPLCRPARPVLLQPSHRSATETCRQMLLRQFPTGIRADWNEVLHYGLQLLRAI